MLDGRPPLTGYFIPAFGESAPLYCRKVRASSNLTVSGMNLNTQRTTDTNFSTIRIDESTHSSVLFPAFIITRYLYTYIHWQLLFLCGKCLIPLTPSTMEKVVTEEIKAQHRSEHRSIPSNKRTTPRTPSEYFHRMECVLKTVHGYGAACFPTGVNE